MRGVAVDNRGETVRADEDRIRLVAEVEQLEADAALRLLAADALAEVDPLRAHVRQRLDALDGGAADVEDLEEGAAGSGRKREHAGGDGEDDREAERERA